jgi:hypothetical protein
MKAVETGFQFIQCSLSCRYQLAILSGDFLVFDLLSRVFDKLLRFVLKSFSYDGDLPTKSIFV